MRKENKSKSQRNGMISLMKFIFSLIIIVFHAGKLRKGYEGYPKTNIGYLCVDFFFIVSGFYFAKGIVKAFNKKSNIYFDNLKIIWSKFKHFLPYMLFSVIVLDIIYFICFKMSVTNIVLSFYNIFLIQMFGLPHLPNGPTWYISAMLITMFIFYPIIRKKKKKYVYFICPLIILFGLGIMYQNYRSLHLYHSNWNGLFYGGLIRSIVDMNIGFAFALIIDDLNKWLDSLKIKYLNFLLTIFEVFIYVCLVVVMLTIPSEGKFIYFILLVIIGVCGISFTERSYMSSLLDNKLIHYLEKISLPIFINQYIFMDLVLYYQKNHSLHYFIALIITLVGTILISIIEYQIIEFITKRKKTNN